MGTCKIQDSKFIHWVFENISWDIIRWVCDLLFSILFTPKILIRPNVQKWLFTMNISTVVSILGIFIIIFIIAWVLLSLVEWLYKKISFFAFLKKQKEITTNTWNLVNIAVENSLSFLQGVSYSNEPSLQEQCKMTRDSGKELMEYFQGKDNGLYYSSVARKNIVELYELISICTQSMYEAIRDSFHVKLWNIYADQLIKSKNLREEINSDFREIFKKM